MRYEVVDRETACAIQREALRTWRVVGWIVVENHPGYPGRFVARLLSGDTAPYLLVDDTLSGLRAQLPPGLKCQHATPQGAVEIWFVS
jgi:hypothetical protein